MERGFRPFKDKNEETAAKVILAAIDKGEKDIFENSEVVNKQCLFYSYKDIIGVYCKYLYDDEVHIQIGFNKDMPKELTSELLNLIVSAQREVKCDIDIWYSPRNGKLEKFLNDNLKWKKQGSKTYEVTAINNSYNKVHSRQIGNVTIIPFQEKYIIDTCSILDKSLAHTYDDPTKGIFLNNKNTYANQWREKGKIGECCIMMEDDIVIGAYILSGAEIEVIAVSSDNQGKGFGGQLLRHAINHILKSHKELPYLYCEGYNSNALNFYQHEGMDITAYSSYIVL